MQHKSHSNESEAPFAIFFSEWRHCH